LTHFVGLLRASLPNSLHLTNAMNSSDPHLIGQLLQQRMRFYPEHSEMLTPYFVTTVFANGLAAMSK
jgi:hypothetical protein